MSHDKTMSGAPFHLLVVDDDPLIAESLRLIVPKNWQLISANSQEKVPARLLFHAAFIDMHLTNNAPAQGPEIIAHINKANPKIEIVAMSGDLNLELMEKCLSNGAKKFIAKPLIKDEVLSILDKIEALWDMRETESRGGKRVSWIGKSAATDKIKTQLASLKGEAGPILIEGETGTGKEIAFRLLNQQESHRPFITVNIASIPENLFESEMYGHVKGAFTGADSHKIGLCEAAHGGDLFLDEIEAMPLSQQVKLLRFLESGEVRKVGAKEPTVVKTRVIAASNQNLSQLVRDGKFREDLLFRISGKKIQLPPLRERKEDVIPLAEYFLSLEKPRINKQFSPEALQTMQSYAWPGNVRELRRICEQLALTSPLPIIRSEDVIRFLDVDTAIPEVLNKSLTQMMEEFEAQMIRKALQIHKDVDTAAEALQISRSSLYKKIKDYNLQEIP